MSRKKKHEHANHERWLVSYADFITLLFAFFVVLFASSQADKKKQLRISAAMQSAFTPLSVFETHSQKPPLTEDTSTATNATPAALALPIPSLKADTTAETEAHLRKLFEAQEASGGIPPGSVSFHNTEEGLVISLHEIGFFASGSAEVRPSSLAVLSSLAAALPPGPFRIEGHTDNVPIHTAQFATNWELSTARATAIARLLLQHHNINPADLSAAGYAEFHPIADNTTESGRTQNRRVDIILLRYQAPSQ